MYSESSEHSLQPTFCQRINAVSMRSLPPDSWTRSEWHLAGDRELQTGFGSPQPLLFLLQLMTGFLTTSQRCHASNEGHQQKAQE